MAYSPFFPPTEPLAEFKAALKHSISHRTGSESTDGRPSFSRQESTFLTRSFTHQASTEVDAFGTLTDHLSRISLEDIPGVAHPSPVPAFIHADSKVVDDEDKGKKVGKRNLYLFTLKKLEFKLTITIIPFVAREDCEV